MTQLRYIVVILVLWLNVATVWAQPLRVAVASNFAATAQILAAEFTRDTLIAVDLIVGSTGKLFAQIVQGAPYDVFMSADTERPQRLIELGKASSNSVQLFAVGQLVIWSREGLALEQIWRQPPARFAMANPRLAPYGAAAQEVLKDRGLWDAWVPAMIQGENIGQALQFALSGTVDYAFLSKSQESALQGIGTIHVLTPQRSSSLSQGVVVLNDSESAYEFLNFLQSLRAREIIRSQGYKLP